MAIYIEPISGKKRMTYKVRYRTKGKNKCKTFPTYEQAKRHVKRLNSLPKSLKKNSATVPTLGKALQTLLTDPRTQEAIKGAASNLRMLLNYDIATIPTNELRGSDLIDHCEQRKTDASRPSPATLYHDITNIISSMKLAKTLFNLSVNINSLNEGKDTLYKMEKISGSTARKRRPTNGELGQIFDLAASIQAKPRFKLPIFDVISLALETAMRRGEVVKVTWGDYKPQQKTLIIRRRKAPKKREDQAIWLSPKAIAIIERQQKGKPDDPIFPFSACSITASWRKICKQLQISNLRFHDLRAEAACRYYKQGWNIVRIAKQTGHRDVKTLDNFYLRLGVIEHSLLDTTRAAN